MGQQLTPLDIRQLEGEDKGYWQVLSELRYRLNSGVVLSIPPGFKTDLQSIPPFAWSIVGHPADEHAVAGVCHDWLYRRPGSCLPPGKKPRKRRLCDREYLNINIDKECGWKKRTAKHWVVRLFGWRPWNRYRKADN